MPDLLNAYSQGGIPQLRYPDAVRPWQHVLDCLNGYLTLTDALLAGGGQGAWNFGPAPGSSVTVGEVARLVASRFGQPAEYVVTPGQPEEAGMLTLDVARASQELGWVNRLDVADAVAWTAAFPRDGAGDPRAVALDQIRAFSALA